jgi:hypothetical protein
MIVFIVLFNGLFAVILAYIFYRVLGERLVNYLCPPEKVAEAPAVKIVVQEPEEIQEMVRKMKPVRKTRKKSE